MEIERSPGEMGKKLWNIVRIVLYMMKKSIGKSGKTMVIELNMLLKKGKTVTKAISNLAAALHHRHHYYAALTCRSDDANTSFISPRHYEFSCTNTPLFHSKRKNHHHGPRPGSGGAAEELKVMHKVFEILNKYDGAAGEASPLPGFGGTPTVRQLRVTDSPFPVKDDAAAAGEERHQVDMDAEEFIKKFYKDLKNQKRIAALESPSPYHMWAR